MQNMHFQRIQPIINSSVHVSLFIAQRKVLSIRYNGFRIANQIEASLQGPLFNVLV